MTLSLMTQGRLRGTKTLNIQLAWCLLYLDTMKIYKHKETGKVHVRMADGTMSKGFDSVDELKVLLKALQRNARQRARYDTMRSCGLTKTPYGWE